MFNTKQRVAVAENVAYMIEALREKGQVGGWSSFAKRAEIDGRTLFKVLDGVKVGPSIYCKVAASVGCGVVWDLAYPPKEFRRRRDLAEVRWLSRTVSALVRKEANREWFGVRGFFRWWRCLGVRWFGGWWE